MAMRVEATQQGLCGYDGCDYDRQSLRGTSFQQPRPHVRVWPTEEAEAHAQSHTLSLTKLRRVAHIAHRFEDRTCSNRTAVFESTAVFDMSKEKISSVCTVRAVITARRSPRRVRLATRSPTSRRAACPTQPTLVDVRRCDPRARPEFEPRVR